MANSAASEALPLHLIDGVPVARLTERHRVFEQAVELLAGAIRQAVADGHPHLLADVSAAAFEAPSLASRLGMVRQWAEIANGRLRLAMVAPRSFIDPEGFGIVAAGSFGLAAQVFVLEADAVAWLREEHAADLRRRATPPRD
jgi:class 3 adenylate cyclase